MEAVLPLVLTYVWVENFCRPIHPPLGDIKVLLAVDLAIEVAGISTAVASALVVVSSTQSTLFAADHASSSLCLEDNVVLQFDATHRLYELTTS
jgi:hypothetical protein